MQDRLLIPIALTFVSAEQLPVIRILLRGVPNSAAGIRAAVR
jgi:hypothetical protein